MTGALKCFSESEKHCAKIASDFFQKFFMLPKKYFSNRRIRSGNFFKKKIQKPKFINSFSSFRFDFQNQKQSKKNFSSTLERKKHPNLNFSQGLKFFFVPKKNNFKKLPLTEICSDVKKLTRVLLNF